MNELHREIWENGIHYTLIGDYYFPDVRSPGLRLLRQMGRPASGVYEGT